MSSTTDPVLAMAQDYAALQIGTQEGAEAGSEQTDSTSESSESDGESDEDNGVPSAAAAPEPITIPVDIGPALQRLPDEVLMHIWQELESPASLASTSRRFYCLSKDLALRSRWLLHRFHRYQVLFEAIARPKIFSVGLFERLLRGGANVSLNLAQMLHVLHSPSRLTGQTGTEWGRISLESFLAVLEHARKLYGAIPLDEAHLESMVFNEFLLTGSDNLAKMKKQFKRGFMPLPLAFSSAGIYESDEEDGRLMIRQSDQKSLLRQALIQEPGFAACMLANGYTMSNADSLWISRNVFFKSCTARASSHDIKAQLRQLRKVGLKIERAVASNVVYSLRLKESSYSPPENAYLQAYLALLSLHQAGRLDFDLESVVAEVIDVWRGGGVDEGMALLLERVEKDWPNIDIRTLVVRLAFLTAEEDHINDIAALKAMMRGREVTYDDCLSASLRNLSVSTLPLQYGHTYVEDFDGEKFVKELLDGLLHQPYRGAALRKLHDLLCLGRDMAKGVDKSLEDSVDFVEMLADAVEGQDFSAHHVPPQEWLLEDCNRVAPVRSILAFGVSTGFGENAVPVSKWKPAHTPNASTPTGPCLLKGFTRFSAPTKAQQPTIADESAQSDESADLDPPRASSSPPLFFEGLRRALSRSAESERLFSVQHLYTEHFLKQRLASERIQNMQYLKDGQRYDNLHGTLPQTPEARPLAQVIVDLLGVESKAASVILAHSFVNGNRSLTDVLLRKGVPLTFEHLKIGAKVGYALSTALSEIIQNGAAFRATFAAEVNKPDGHFLSQKKDGPSAALTEIEQSMCSILSQYHFSASTPFYVDIDYAGALYVYTSRHARQAAVDSIATWNRPKSHGAYLATSHDADSPDGTATAPSQTQTSSTSLFSSQRAEPRATTLPQGGSSSRRQPRSTHAAAARAKAKLKARQVRSSRASPVATRSQADENGSEGKDEMDKRSKHEDLNDDVEEAATDEKKAKKAPAEIDQCRYLVRFHDYSPPISLGKAELDERTRSAELWLSHLQVLCQCEDRKHAAVNIWNRDTAARRSNAHTSLAVVLLPGVTRTLECLQMASLAPIELQPHSPARTSGESDRASFASLDSID